MKKSTKSIRVLLIILISVVTYKSNAQLGFCTGNSGDPIFNETFGTGTTDGPALPNGTTTYNFTTGTPSDGDYTISSTINYFDWHNTPDHTLGDTNGKSLIVNASFTAGEFYRTTITGLCENTSYEFSAWLINLLPPSACGGNGIPINVTFEIWDNTDTNLLAAGNTGSIAETSSPNWEQYALVFQTIPAQTSVILKMLNNGVGGCGNDLAIDDIVFKSCGDFISITDSQTNNSISICNDDAPYSTQLTATPDFSIFSTHAYQWQESTDGVTWVDISGETNQSYFTSAVSNTMFYRVLVAEDAINLGNPLCNVVSEIFEIIITQRPNAPISDGDVLICENLSQALSVTVPADVIVNWYDADIGGNLIQENSTTLNTDVPETYYAEAISGNSICASNTRTPVNLAFLSIPQLFDETLTFCEDGTIELSADFPNETYLWNTGAMTEEITVASQGTYTVVVTNNDGCSSTKTVELTQIDKPIIESAESNGSSLIITTTNMGDFEYSVDGISYQASNVFSPLEGGQYTIYVRERSGCGVTTLSALHFVIPKFFTPNGDNSNETFDLKGIEFYANNEVFIFDRYGKLLKSSKNAPFKWDGTFINELLPSSDYWYVITIEGQRFAGHFTLKR